MIDWRLAERERERERELLLSHLLSHLLLLAHLLLLSHLLFISRLRLLSHLLLLILMTFTPLPMHYVTHNSGHLIVSVWAREVLSYIGHTLDTLMPK